MVWIPSSEFSAVCDGAQFKRFRAECRPGLLLFIATVVSTHRFQIRTNVLNDFTLDSSCIEIEPIGAKGLRSASGCWQIGFIPELKYSFVAHVESAINGLPREVLMKRYEASNSFVEVECSQRVLQFLIHQGRKLRWWGGRHVGTFG